MGKFDDILNGFNAEESEITPDFLSELRNAHNEDMSIPTAKIEQLTGVLSEKDKALTDAHKEVTEYKAKNYDLLTSIPREMTDVLGVQVPNGVTDENTEGPDIDDFFGTD